MSRYITRETIHVGAAQGAVKEARQAINDILNSQEDQETKREALRCLQHLCEVSNTTIQNCNFTQK